MGGQCRQRREAVLALALLVLVLAQGAVEKTRAAQTKAPRSGGLPAELQELQAFLNSIVQEESTLEQQVQVLMQVQVQLLSQLQGIQTVTLPEFDSVGEQQTTDLEQRRTKLNGLLASFGPLEASLAGLRAVSESNEASTRLLKQGLDELRAVNNRHGAALVRLNTVLNEAKEKLHEKTELRVQQSSLSVDSLQNNLNTLGNFMGSRKCIQNTVMVEVDPETGSGSANMTLSPEGVFGNLMPSVLCLLEAFQSQAGLSNTQTDSGSKKSVALVINCQPSTDKVKVTAVDQSQGQENAITKAYVTVKACSLGAMV